MKKVLLSLLLLIGMFAPVFANQYGYQGVQELNVAGFILDEKNSIKYFENLLR